MVTGCHPCSSSGILRLLPGPVPGGPVTGTLHGKVVLLPGMRAMCPSRPERPGVALVPFRLRRPQQLVNPRRGDAVGSVSPACPIHAPYRRFGDSPNRVVAKAQLPIQRHPATGSSDCHGTSLDREVRQTGTKPSANASGSR